MPSDGDLAGLRAVVLAGGRGTRLSPYTTVLPKPLMPVGDMPILEILLRRLRSAGVRDVTLSVGYLASLLEAYFGDGGRWGLRIEYSREQEPLGTAGPLALVPGLNDTFLVMNGDLMTTLDFREIVRVHREQGAVATLGLFRKEVNIDLGVIETDGGGRVVEYIEKPTLTYEVSVGMYVMQPQVLQYIPAGQPLDLPELIRRLAGDGHLVFGYRFSGHWLDIGRHEDHALAIELMERERAAFLPDD
jgi:NDP-sugar pyrophosphorylase family protein